MKGACSTYSFVFVEFRMSATVDSGAVIVSETTAGLEPATHHHAMTPAIDFIGGVAGEKPNCVNVLENFCHRLVCLLENFN